MTVTPLASRTHLAAVRRRPQTPARLRRNRRQRHVELDRHRGRGQDVREVARGRPAASSSSNAPRGVVTRALGAVDAAIDDGRSRARRRRGRCRTSRRGRRNDDGPRHDPSSSALATSSGRRRSRPRGSRPSRRRWRRRDPKKPRCASPTLVHTRTSGSATRTSVLISPAWFIPSSTTAISGRCLSSMSDSGSPMWLLKFPRLRTTRYRAARNSPVTSFVVVLPALPVIATTFVPDSRRIAVRQRLQRRGRVVDLDDGHRRSSRLRARSRPQPRPRSTTTPAAPASIAASDEVGAVEPLAANRDEQLAGRQRPRVDRDAAELLATGRPYDAACPPICAGHPRRRQPDSGLDPLMADRVASYDARVGPPPSQRLARHRDVVERQHAVADHLVLLVSLAGDRARHRPAAASSIALAIASRRSTIASSRCAAVAPRVGRDAALDLLDDPRRDPRCAGCPT